MDNANLQHSTTLGQRSEMRKQTGTYGTEDQTILSVPVSICSHLTRNHFRQPVTPAPIRLMARDSLLLALAPQHTLGMLGTQAALPGVRWEAGGRPVAVGVIWKVSCLLPAATALQFQGGFSPPPN